MAESIQHKLDRVRPPRVQITYDVQIGDAFEVKELPLVVGVMADLSGQLPDGVTPPKLRDRQFVEIDRDSFRDIFGKINPRSSFTVDNLMRANARMPPRIPGCRSTSMPRPAPSSITRSPSMRCWQICSATILSTCSTRCG